MYVCEREQGERQEGAEKIDVSRSVARYGMSIAKDRTRQRRSTWMGSQEEATHWRRLRAEGPWV